MMGFFGCAHKKSISDWIEKVEGTWEIYRPSDISSTALASQILAGKRQPFVG